MQTWLRENGETLIHIYLHHSGSGGTLYLLKSPDQVKVAIEYAASAAAQYGDGRATLTAFHSSYYPLRGNVDASLIEKIQVTWSGERWYAIVSVEDSFPSPLRTIGSGDTAQEFDNDLADLLSNWKDHLVGFGEHPLDMGDWAARNHVEVIETTVGTFKQ